MKRLLAAVAIGVCSISLFAADLRAKAVADEAVKKASAEDAVAYVRGRLKDVTVQSEKRSLYIFLGSLQEQLSHYDDARASYVAAAGISAADADDMPKKSNEQLVLDAVRCALCTGDAATADSYLNSAVRNSKNPKIQSYVKLYSQWSALCRAESVDDLQEPLELLKAYTKVKAMQELWPAVYLTLWYVTGESSYSKEILAKFPSSIEAAIVKGDAQLLPTPFWFFVPKSGLAEAGTGTVTITEEPAAVPAAPKATKTAATEPPVKLQLGLFGVKANAEHLVEELKAKGFAAYTAEETRASGTTYYIVLVNEDKTNSVAEKLRSSGYECYVAN